MLLVVVTLAIKPEMYDNSLNFEPTFIDTGVLYFTVKCQASVAVEDRKPDADTHLAMLGVKRGNRHFGCYLRIKSSSNAAFYRLQTDDGWKRYGESVRWKHMADAVWQSL